MIVGNLWNRLLNVTGTWRHSKLTSSLLLQSVSLKIPTTAAQWIKASFACWILLYITVQDYMQLFGRYQGPNILDLTRHSIHSVNFYQTRWAQHQMELFNPVLVYPHRSNTISAISDISSQNGDVFSVISNSSSDDSQVAFSPLPVLRMPKVSVKE